MQQLHTTMNAIPLSLYIHTPWCVQKCPYCDFNSHTLRSDLPEQAYIDALIADLQDIAPAVWGRRVQTVFIGGGTPSLFAPAEIARLLSAVRSIVQLAPQAEITLEANPGTVEQQRFAGFLQAGVNRLSLGLQSLNDQQLQRLGRIHDSAAAKQAVFSARAAGFDNINVDMMFALPQQTQDEALQDLQQAIDLKPTHLSWYQLTLEPNTAFYANPPKLPADDAAADIYAAGQALLAAHGFTQYEISAYHAQNNPCQHNVNYWLFGDYLGIGAGAHSKITDFATQTITRGAKHRHPKQYLSDPTGFAERRDLVGETLAFEFMLNALRLYQTIPVSVFEARTGLPLTVIADVLEQAQQRGLVIYDTKQLGLTDLGRRFYNDVVAMFL